MSVIAITHTPTEGTLVYGTTRGDGSRDVLGPAGFRWYRSMGAWGIVGSRDRRPDTATIEHVAAALRGAGFTVVVDMDAGVRLAADSGADEQSRRGGRATASRAATAQQTMARTVAATADAQARRRRAEASAAAEAHRRPPVAVKIRLARLQSAQRRDERSRDGYRTLSKATGAVKDCPPVTGAHRERLLTRIADRQEQIDYWTSIYAAQQAQGIATAFSREMISRGDAVCYRNRWYEVTRVNAKSVTVKMARGSGSIGYQEISEHRRAAAAAEATVRESGPGR